jgi:hypothetical protein
VNTLPSDIRKQYTRELKLLLLELCTGGLMGIKRESAIWLRSINSSVLTDDQLHSIHIHYMQEDKEREARGMLPPGVAALKKEQDRCKRKRNTRRNEQ